MSQVIVHEDIKQEPDGSVRRPLRIDSDIPPEQALMLLAQALELLRVQVVLKTINEVQKRVVMPNGG